MDRPLRTNYSNKYLVLFLKKDQVLMMLHLVEGGDLEFPKTISPNKYLVLFVKKTKCLCCFVLWKGETQRIPGQLCWFKRTSFVLRFPNPDKIC